MPLLLLSWLCWVPRQATSPAPSGEFGDPTGLQVLPEPVHDPGRHLLPVAIVGRVVRGVALHVAAVGPSHRPGGRRRENQNATGPSLADRLGRIGSGSTTRCQETAQDSRDLPPLHENLHVERAAAPVVSDH